MNQCSSFVKTEEACVCVCLWLIEWVSECTCVHVNVYVDTKWIWYQSTSSWCMSFLKTIRRGWLWLGYIWISYMMYFSYFHSVPYLQSYKIISEFHFSSDNLKTRCPMEITTAIYNILLRINLWNCTKRNQ